MTFDAKQAAEEIRRKLVGGGRGLTQKRVDAAARLAAKAYRVGQEEMREALEAIRDKANEGWVLLTRVRAQMEESGQHDDLYHEIAEWLDEQSEEEGTGE